MFHTISCGFQESFVTYEFRNSKIFEGALNSACSETLQACKCNVKLRKLHSAHKSHVRETSFLTVVISIPVRNSQTSRFVSVPGQNPGRSSRGDSVMLRLQSVMMADKPDMCGGAGVEPG